MEKESKEYLGELDFSKQKDQEKFKTLSSEEKNKIIEASYAEAEEIILAKTIGMDYEGGSGDVVSGIGDREVKFDRGIPIWWRTEGKKIIGGGYGTYVVVSPSHFILNAEVEGKNVEIWTERDFRLSLDVDRLTPKIRKIIQENMPDFVQVFEKTGRKGTKYYKLAESDVLKWVEKIRKKIEVIKKSRKKSIWAEIEI